jgi:hypothetical protein
VGKYSLQGHRRYWRGIDTFHRTLDQTSSATSHQIPRANALRMPGPSSHEGPTMVAWDGTTWLRGIFGGLLAEGRLSVMRPGRSADIPPEIADPLESLWFDYSINVFMPPFFRLSMRRALVERGELSPLAQANQYPTIHTVAPGDLEPHPMEDRHRQLVYREMGYLARIVSGELPSTTLDWPVGQDPSFGNYVIRLPDPRRLDNSA